jgi:prolyl-tRNA synthetase
MGAVFSDDKQQQRALVMGCYGIGVSRLVATTVEQHHDENGIRWPISVAPYHVHLVTLGKEADLVSVAAALHKDLQDVGIEVLWDDRDERPGVKFKDGDLIGIPLRVTIGAKGLAAGSVELKERAERDAKKVELVPIHDAAAAIASRVASALRTRS